MMKPGRIILILSLCGILAAWPGAGKAAAGPLPDFIPAALADLWNPVAQSEASPGDGTDSDSQGFLGRVRLLAGEVPNLLIVFIFLFFLCLLEGVVLVLWDSDRQHQRRLKKRLKYLDRLEKRF